MLGVFDSSDMTVFDPNSSTLADTPTSEMSSSDSESDETSKYGFDYDFNHGYDEQWSSLADSEAWMLEEHNSCGVEFVVKERVQNKAPLHSRHWLTKVIYVCSCHESGGVKKYDKKTGNNCRIPTKRQYSLNSN